MSLPVFLRDVRKLRGRKPYTPAQRKRIETEWTEDLCDKTVEELAKHFDAIVRFPSHRWSEPSNSSRKRDNPVISTMPMPLNPLRDFVDEWNFAVPSCRTEWHPERSPAAALRMCAADPDFCARFPEVCKIAQQAHEARGAEVSWLTFEWIISEKNGRLGWWRLLTDLKGMAARSTPKSKFEQRLEDSRVASRMLAEQQAQMRQQRTRERTR